MEPGEPVTLTAQVADKKFLDVNDARVVAVVRSPTGVVSEVPLSWTVKRDGEYQATFVRLMYRGFGRGGSSWAHDYPRGDEHFMKIVNAVTLLNPHMDGETNILALDDPELFNYPVAYMAEPGFWTMSEAELAGLKAYIEKGGFLIFDDFRLCQLDGIALLVLRPLFAGVGRECQRNHTRNGTRRKSSRKVSATLCHSAGTT